MAWMERTGRLVVALGGLAVVLGLAGPLAATGRAETVFRLGHTLPASSHYGVGAQAFAEAVSIGSGGRYRIDVFPSNALAGGEREMIEGTLLGVIDVVVTSTGPIGNFVPMTMIMDIPFLFRDYAHARAVLDGTIGEEILAEFPTYGLIGLAWAENGFRHLTNNQRPVRTPEDLKGLKIRTMQNDVHLQAFATLGALPTPMSWPDVLGALQQGVVHGQENPIVVVVAAQFGGLQKYLSLTRHVYSPALFIMSPLAWETLAPEDRTLFVAAARKGAAAMRVKVEQMERDGVALLREQGMIVEEQIDQASFQSALSGAYAAYGSRFGQDRIDRIRNYQP